MTELKTLKEIEKQEGIDMKVEPYYYCQRIRAEAIKWVKKKGHYGLCLQDWEDFFNLTEEELKNEK